MVKIWLVMISASDEICWKILQISFPPRHYNLTRLPKKVVAQKFKSWSKALRLPCFYSSALKGATGTEAGILPEGHCQKVHNWKNFFPEMFSDALPQIKGCLLVGNPEYTTCSTSSHQLTTWAQGSKI